MDWKKHIVNWGFFLLLFLLLLQFFGGSKKQTELDMGPLGVRMGKNKYAVGQEIAVQLKNNTETEIGLASSCPNNPFTVLRFESGEFKKIEAKTDLDCSRISPTLIKPTKTVAVSFSNWNYALFGTPGRYKVEVPFQDKILSTPEFIVEPRGIFKTLWNVLFYQPIYNALIGLIEWSPGHSLGIAIIALTILIRLLLLIPSQRGLHSQKRMQELQPKLEHIKKKYAGNQERIAKETMGLWKENKVNPFGSCLPLLIQFPFLIALFYVIQNGLNPDTIHLLYGPLKNFEFSTIKTDFLGILELKNVNFFVLPLIVGLLQFAQMKLMMFKRQSQQENKDATPSELQMVNKMMVYFMPVMIAVFTASVPAGVGLYWGISTVFGIGQQLIVNKAKGPDKKHSIIEGEVVQ